LLRGQVSSAGRSALIRVAFRGLTLAAAVQSIPMSPTFLPRLGWNFFQWGRSAVSWHCAASLNCWPVQPKRRRESKTRNACRIPEEARKGGSKVWFLPPPGSKVRNKKGVRSVLGRCELVACETSDMMAERVGFGNDGAWQEGIEFVNMTKNTEGCDSVSRPLDKKECSLAARQSGYPNVREQALSAFPAGCFLYHGHGMYWNSNPVGKAQEDSANVCAVKVSEAKGGRPNVYNCQNLKFEEMTDVQQQLYLEDVRKTLPEEYKDEI